MYRKTSVICLEVLLGIIVVSGLLLVGTAWRVSQGPVSLRFLLPYAKGILQDESSQVRVEVDDVFLTWAGWERALDLRAEGIGFRTADGQRLARIREVSVGLSFRALLEGVVAPTSLDVIRPRLLLVRTESGEIEPGIGEPSDEPSGGQARNQLTPLLDGLSGPPRPDSRLRYLNRIRIIGGALRVQDRQLGITWGARQADVSLARRNDGLGVAFDLELDLPDAPAIRGDIGYIKEQNRVRAQLEFERFDPSVLAARHSALAPLNAIAAAVGGKISANIGTDGQLYDARFSLATGPGSFSTGADTAPVRFRSVAFTGELNRNPDQVKLTESLIELGDGRVELTGLATRVGPAATISATARIATLPVNSLERYWPAAAASGARKWVLANIRDGDVKNGTANVAARVSLDGEDAGKLAVDSVSGGFTVEGATIDYLAPMPKITEAMATASFTRQRFDFAVHSGRVGNQKISDGAVNIWDIGSAREWLAVSALIKGPTADALAVVGHPRLDLLSRFELDPAGASGTHATRLNVKLPLIGGLKGSDVAVGVSSRLENLALRNILKGGDITAGTVELKVDNASLKAEGAATYAGTPVRFIWMENFLAKAALRREISLGLVLEQPLRHRFGIDFPDIFQGPASARLVVRDGRDGGRSLAASLNLAEARLTLPGFDWTKPPGQKAEAEISARFANDSLREITNLRVTADAMALTARATFAPESQKFRSATIDRFQLGENDFAGSVGIEDNGTIAIDVKGAALDARPFIAQLTREGTSPPLPALSINGAFDRIRINDGPPTTDGRLLLSRDAARWRQVQIDTVFPGTEKASSFKLESGDAGDALSLYTADAGSFVQALRISDAISGGEIEARAIRTGADAPWNGAAEMKRFRIAGASTLARILTLASLTGISDVVSGKEGISFDRMVMPFRFGDSVATIADLRAVGSELGITASGQIDLKKDMIEIRGTIVPAYTINSLIGKIPVIGPLITGGKGGGIFAASYEITGPVDDPKTSVNPLSTLAPGFLRKLLEGGSSSTSSAVPPTNE